MPDAGWDAALSWLHTRIEGTDPAIAARARSVLDWSEWSGSGQDAWGAYTLTVRLYALAYVDRPDFPEVLRLDGGVP